MRFVFPGVKKRGKKSITWNAARSILDHGSQLHIRSSSKLPSKTHLEYLSDKPLLLYFSNPWLTTTLFHIYFIYILIEHITDHQFTASSLSRKREKRRYLKKTQYVITMSLWNGQFFIKHARWYQVPDISRSLVEFLGHALKLPNNDGTTTQTPHTVASHERFPEKRNAPLFAIIEFKNNSISSQDHSAIQNTHFINIKWMQDSFYIYCIYVYCGRKFLFSLKRAETFLSFSADRRFLRTRALFYRQRNQIKTNI